MMFLILIICCLLYPSPCWYIFSFGNPIVTTILIISSTHLFLWCLLCLLSDGPSHFVACSIQLLSWYPAMWPAHLHFSVMAWCRVLNLILLCMSILLVLEHISIFLSFRILFSIACWQDGILILTLLQNVPFLPHYMLGKVTWIHNNLFQFQTVVSL